MSGIRKLQCSDNPLQKEFLSSLIEQPRFATSSQALLNVYRQKIYGRIRQKNAEHVLLGQSAKLGLTLQWLLESARGHGRKKGRLIDQGLTPLATNHFKSVQDEIAVLGDQEFRSPLIFVAGYPRSGTSSLQNITLKCFAEHIPLPKDSEYPIVWWELKHDARLARSLVDLGKSTVRVTIPIRPFVGAAASWSVRSGELSDEWIYRQVADWERMALIAMHPKCLALPFQVIQESKPFTVSRGLEGLLNIKQTTELQESTTWKQLFEKSPVFQELLLPTQSNLPHEGRASLLTTAENQITATIGSKRISELDDLYQQVIGPSERYLKDAKIFNGG